MRYCPVALAPAALVLVACAHTHAPAARASTPSPPLAPAPPRAPTPARTLARAPDAAAALPTPPDIPRVAPHGAVDDGHLHAAILQRLSQPLPAPCVEGELPAAFRLSDTPPDPGDNLGRGLALTLPHGTVIAGRGGHRDAAVYLSYALDPSSEIGDAGYRLRVRDGRTGRELDGSLGFAQTRPYVVQSATLLPLLDGDVLQLAVDVREIDDASITFPPVAMRAKREARNRLLRCPLATVFHDADGDGATDVDEARLATDPGDADTDGDGLPDGKDPAPLGAVAARSPEETLWVAAMRELVAKDVPGEMIITLGDGPRLDLRDVPLRVLQLRPDELAAYERRFGKRVTFDLGIKMDGPEKAEVSVGFGWRGSEYLATRHGAGPWTFMPRGEWISRLLPTGDGGPASGRASCERAASWRFVRATRASARQTAPRPRG